MLLCLCLKLISSVKLSQVFLHVFGKTIEYEMHPSIKRLMNTIKRLMNTTKRWYFK